MFDVRRTPKRDQTLLCTVSLAKATGLFSSALFHLPRLPSPILQYRIKLGLDSLQLSLSTFGVCPSIVSSSLFLCAIFLSIQHPARDQLLEPFKIQGSSLAL